MVLFLAYWHNDIHIDTGDYYILGGDIGIHDLFHLYYDCAA